LYRTLALKEKPFSMTVNSLVDRNVTIQALLVLPLLHNGLYCVLYINRANRLFNDTSNKPRYKLRNKTAQISCGFLDQESWHIYQHDVFAFQDPPKFFFVFIDFCLNRRKSSETIDILRLLGCFKVAFIAFDFQAYKKR